MNEGDNASEETKSSSRGSHADGRCGLGFKMEEFWIIDENGLLSIAAHPTEECTVKMARTRKDFIKKDAERGIHWDFENIFMKSLVR